MKLHKSLRLSNGTVVPRGTVLNFSTEGFANYKNNKVSLKALEAKTITVITYDNKQHIFTDADIKECLDNMNLSSDNLPKWLYETGKFVGNPTFPNTPEKVRNVLKKILDAKKSVTINVDSKNRHKNVIAFEASTIEVAVECDAKVNDIIDILAKNATIKGKVKTMPFWNAKDKRFEVTFVNLKTNKVGTAYQKMGQELWQFVEGSSESKTKKF